MQMLLTMNREFREQYAINSDIQARAKAYELAARFYGARGFEEFACLYLRRARDCYLRWGAHGKVRQLEARYPQLVRTDPRGGKTEATSPDQQLDVAELPVGDLVLYAVGSRE